MKEIHPWNWYAPKGAKTLIVGTFPPTRRNWKYDFFYPNTNNFFWRIMAEIAGKPLQFFSGEEAVEERRRLLQHLQVAITDMAAEIERSNESSLDENLGMVAFMDIFRILKENPSIKKLVFTSSSKPVSAMVWFLQYLKSKNIIHKFPSGKKPLRSSMVYEGRTIELVVAFSPSARAANRISFAELVEMYRGVIVSAP